MKVTVVQHGRFEIKAGTVEGKFTAYAFVARPKLIKGIHASANGTSDENAIENLKEHLDQVDKKNRKARRYDSVMRFDVPTLDEFMNAVKAVLPSLSSTQQDMLFAHLASGEKGMTAGELSNAGGYSHFETANSIYGRVGRAFQGYLGIDAPAAENREGDVATGIIATEGEQRSDGRLVWVMYPELRNAMLAEYPASKKAN
jgi:hypothetical protein